MNPQDFTQQELEIIMHGLGELPLKMAGPVFTKVQAALMQMMTAERPSDASVDGSVNEVRMTLDRQQP